MSNDKVRVDTEKAESIRKLLSQPGGEKAVAHRYGESEVGSAEYREAQKKQAELRSKTAERRRQAQADKTVQEKKATPTKSKPASKSANASKPSQRERFAAARKAQAERETQSHTR